MPDGSEPSQFAARATLSDTDPESRQADTLPAGKPEGRGFRLGGLFRRRNGDDFMQHTQGNGGRERALSPSEKAMIERVVALERVRVGDVAIPRADIIGIEVTSSIRESLGAFAEAGHSRMPVYRGDLDDPVGFIHIKDVVSVVARDGCTDGDEATIEGLTRKLLYAPPSMPVADLLLRMQAQRIHMALVIDEFGGTDGLVTIEDLIEEIVGDIRDEHDDDDEAAQGLRQTPGGRWDCDARAELDDLADRLGIDLRLPGEDADTLGGLVFSLAGRVPLRGEVIPHPDGHEFEIAEADPRRVRRVLIRLAAPGEPSALKA